MTKKVAIISLLIILTFPSSLLALDTITGNDWHELSENEKEIYAKGWLDGFGLGMVIIIAGFTGENLEETAADFKDDDSLIEEEMKEFIETLNEKLVGEKTIFDLFVEESLEIE